MPVPTWTSLRLPAGALPASYPRLLVLFDGVCTLCDGTVNWLIARDAAPGNGRLRFAALQSRAAQPVLAAAGLAADAESALDSILLVERDGEGEGGGGGATVYRRSTAILRIAGHLPQPWPAAASALLACVPVVLRDAAYGCVAAYRYRVFGRSEDCLRPTPAIRARFLDIEELMADGKKRA